MSSSMEKHKQNRLFPIAATVRVQRELVHQYDKHKYEQKKKKVWTEKYNSLKLIISYSTTNLKMFPKE